MMEEYRQNQGDDEKGFDAEMVITVDHEFRHDKPFKVVIGRGDNVRVTDMSPFEMLKHYSRLRDPRLLKANGAIAELLHRSAVESHVENLDIMGRELVEILLEGRVKIGLLIDSDGGDMEVLNLLRSGMNDLQKRGGESRAYVVGHAGSAAMELFKSAEKKSVLDKSSVLWHFSEISGERRRAVARLRGSRSLNGSKRKELRELEVFLASSPHYSADMWKDFLQIITSEENPEGEIIFTGRHLAELKLVNDSFRRLRNLSAKFSGEFALSRNVEVKDFWILSGIVNLKTNGVDDWADLDFEEMRRNSRHGVRHLARRAFWEEKLRKGERGYLEQVV